MLITFRNSLFITFRISVNEASSFILILMDLYWQTGRSSAYSLTFPVQDRNTEDKIIILPDFAEIPNKVIQEKNEIQKHLVPCTMSLCDYIVPDLT